MTTTNRAAAVTAALALMAVFSLAALAQPVQGQVKPQSPAKSVAPVSPQKTEAKPLWKDLTAEQQQSLKPLAANWPTIDEAQKRKWLAVSRNYPALAPAEQAKLHSRMTEWTSLSARQRTEARMNFAETKKLPPGEKAAKWQAYQALSPEEKQKLAANSESKPRGATTAVKPVAPQKLAEVPTTRRGSKGSPDLALSKQPVDRNTLLPHANAPADGSAVKRN
jgi:Protein of unknown function (DUF3106)